MASTIQPIISLQSQIDPLFATMKSANDSLPKSATPVATYGTIQENTHLLPKVTLYNAHGILQKNDPNSLIGYA